MKRSKKFICIFLLFISCALFIKNYAYKNNINNKEVYLVSKMIYIEANNEEINNNSNYTNATYKNTGIVTCIDSNNRFISLGHNIADGNTVTGKCYIVNEYQIEKSNNSKIGSIKTFANTQNEFGNISDNLSIGLIGNIENNILKSEYKSIKLADKFKVKKGMAKLYLDLEGIDKKYFDIEIININYIDDLRNIEFNLVDEDLKNLAGGLVQGMSGAAIIQNDRLIGIFNSILTDNPCNGYGVFIDKFF